MGDPMMNAPEKRIDRFPAGTVKIPPSKSLGHRALICAALAGGEAAGANVDDPGNSEDIRATRVGIAQIAAVLAGGDAADFVDGEAAGFTGGEAADEAEKIKSTKGTGSAEPAEERVIDCAESGSTLRFLLPIAAAVGGDWLFAGRGRLPERPMEAYERLFPEHGVQMERGSEGIRISGKLRAGTYALSGDVSSQFVSGLLFALPLARGDSTIVLTSPLESADYVALTLEVLRAFGVQVYERGMREIESLTDLRSPASVWEVQGGITGETLTANVLSTYDLYEIPGGQNYRPTDYSVAGDWSQAAFFLCAGALGRSVSVSGLREDSAQGDRRVTEILRRMGISVEWTQMEIATDEPQSHFRAISPDSGFHGTVIDARDIPDIVPPLAALACFAQGETRFEHAGRLRLKESDRLSALARELSGLGADAWEEGDTLVVRGAGDGKSPYGAGLPGGKADAHGDHRIAMAVAVAAIGCRGAVYLTGADSVRKSYPGFWQDFEKEEKEKVRK